MFKNNDTNIADLQKEAILLLARLLKHGLVDEDHSVQRAITDPGNPDELRSIIIYLKTTTQSVERDVHDGIARKGERINWL